MKLFLPKSPILRHFPDFCTHFVYVKIPWNTCFMIFREMRTFTISCTDTFCSLFVEKNYTFIYETSAIIIFFGYTGRSDCVYDCFVSLIFLSIETKYFASSDSSVFSSYSPGIIRSCSRHDYQSGENYWCRFMYWWANYRNKQALDSLRTAV